MNSKSHLVSYPVNNNKDINLVCILRRKPNEKKSIVQLIDKFFFNKNKNLSSFFGEDLKPWSIYTSSKPAKSILKNVFYIGDAFYAFPPTFAQGASQSIESAKELYELLIKNEDNIENIYFEKRRKRIALINNRSKLNQFIFHLSNPIIVFFRNIVLKRLTKQEKFLENYLGKIYKN